MVFIVQNNIVLYESVSNCELAHFCLPQSTSKYPKQTDTQELQVLDALNQTHRLQSLQDYLN